MPDKYDCNRRNGFNRAGHICSVWIPIDKETANTFFQLVAVRYEKKPLIITINKNFNRWWELFSDFIIVNATIYHLAHHSRIIKIIGQSYIIKNKNIYLYDIIILISLLTGYFPSILSK